MIPVDESVPNNVVRKPERSLVYHSFRVMWART